MNLLQINPNADYSWLATMEIFSLIALLAFIILGIIAWRVLPKIIDKRHEMKIKEHDKNYEAVQDENNRILNNIVGKFDNMAASINNILKEQKRQSKDILRLQIFDKNLDDYSRLEAGIDYMRLGGNSKAKTQILELAKDNPEAWDAVCRNNEDIQELNPNYFEDSVNDINRLLGYKQKLLN